MSPDALEEILVRLLVLFFAVGIHEYAHCKFADLAGDPTPRIYGRVTLNLFKHFEPFGTMMMVVSSVTGFGIGWGRPAPMDPNRMGNPRWDFFIAVAAGPISNLCQALLCGCFLRVLLGSQHGFPDESLQFFQFFLLSAVIINITLFLFNLIPFGPLDGHYLLGLLMPERPRNRWFLFNQQIGFAGLIVLVLVLRFTNTDLLSRPIFKLSGMIIGHSLE